MPNIEVKKKSINMSINAGKIYPPLEDLEINPTKEKQVFNHENSYGYDEVVVNPVILQDKTVRPIETEQVVKADDGYVGLNEVTVDKIGQTPYKPRYISFYNYQGTELDEELENLDTSNMTRLYYLFGYCSNFTTMDMSKVKTSHIESFEYLLYYCSKLQSVDFSGCDTSNLMKMQNMLAYCQKLTTINYGENFNTSNVDNMQSLYSYCRMLDNLDMSMFDMSKVNNVNQMFANCQALTNLKFGYNLGKAYHKSSYSNNYDLYFTESPLTRESAMSVINNVYDCKGNGQTGKRTITFKASTYNLLSADDIAIATNKGWTIASR